jgi:2-polyprenyl-3-methyl-5-hydroxy-6-metoxy-1,4-benzoquinol methylase
LSDQEHIIWLCKQCQACYLDQAPLDYESESYRTLVDGNSSVEDYYEAHDEEQLKNLSQLGINNLRNCVVADIGCGAGSFLDLVQGMAKTTIAVEPAKHFQETLATNGHQTFSYIEDALRKWAGKVDMVTCFAVLEHIENPLEFIREIRQLMNSRAVLLLSTPNIDDWMIDFLPQAYGSFFFRHVHRWYFGVDSLKYLARLGGFEMRDISYRQRFDFSNALHWIKLRKPTGLAKLELFLELDEAYRTILEKKGKSDFLYVNLTPRKESYV